ncbi:hypothetical protein MDA_GLEAN10009661 [Myotis davidii]|uniref:Uncharacterized protein n=1 Tax=Myotis davidii TaxID=225400 RepID=L5MD22_MYODS|nr:hypothetical protein MDA_GLEAN10009661 [Myotis davidii]
MLKGWGLMTTKGNFDFKQENGIVRDGIWKDFTVVAMWKLDWSGEEDQLELYDCGNLGKTREAWSKAEAMPKRGAEETNNIEMVTKVEGRTNYGSQIPE